MINVKMQRQLKQFNKYIVLTEKYVAYSFPICEIFSKKQ